MFILAFLIHEQDSSLDGEVRVFLVPFDTFDPFHRFDFLLL
jgi:hypothetical protein